jgi:hypothetical protein
VVGTLIGLAIGASNKALHLPFDSSMTSVYVVCFFVGLFPEAGINWIRRTADKILQQTDADDKQLPLSNIEGISLWHAGRLDQEGIENVQNLASANLLVLVANTPFDVGLVVDWVDQAVLLMHIPRAQVEVFQKAGLRYASDVVEAVSASPEQLHTVSGISVPDLVILRLALKSSTNMGLIERYREHQRRLEVRQPVAPTEAPLVPVEPSRSVPQAA